MDRMGREGVPSSPSSDFDETIPFASAAVVACATWPIAPFAAAVDRAACSRVSCVRRVGRSFGRDALG